eukprot:scaffold28321_cov236-Isochrysis_galbana.AAC.3
MLCGSCLVSLPSSHQDCIQETSTCGRSASQSRQRAPCLSPPPIKTAYKRPLHAVEALRSLGKERRSLL